MDLRAALNAISDVVNNRPSPIRAFDQIYMKSADMLLQAEHVSRWFEGKRVVFIGDGDAIGLSLVHLHKTGIFDRGPAFVHVLDFDERIVHSIERFADRFEVADRVTAELYNVADPMPERHWQKFDAFYTNPPFGESNGGSSMRVFVDRGIEAVGNGAVACIVAADHEAYPWSQEVLFSTERQVLDRDFIISELIPAFHAYHLYAAPDLRSCSIIVRRLRFSPQTYRSESLPERDRANFYGEENPLRYRFVRDLSSGGKLGPTDYELEPL